MAERNLNGKIIQILYTTEELSQEPLCDIIIDKGIVVYEKCNDGQIKMKIGDGVNIWSELNYIGKESEINDELISSETTYSSTKIEDLINETNTTINNAITTKADIDYVKNLYETLNSNTTLGFYCIEDVTIVTNGISKVYSANSNVEVAFTKDDVFEIIPTSDKSILQLNAFPNALGTYYSWLEGVKQFSNILFDMNAEDMYSKWSQGNQGAYQVQFAQYVNCIFWSDNSYISDVSKRTNYTLYYSSQLPLCYSTIPDNTFKSFYLAFNVNSDPNWGNKAYRDSFAKATWATQAFSYYGARTIGIFGHDDPDFNITLPKDCRGLMCEATAIENAGTFDAINVTNFGAKNGSWRDAFRMCYALRNLYIKNLKVNLNVSWSPLNYESIYFIISTAANTNKITISVSPYTYNLLSQSDFELATSKNITIELLTGNYVEDGRLSDIANKADKTDILNLQDEIDSIKGITDEKLAESKAYTDTKVSDLVGTAPETLNTLEEVAKAIEENEDVVEALNGAIGNKANQSDLNDLNNKINNIKTVEINDEQSSTTSTYSSNKINNLLDTKTSINDSNSSTTSTYSSNKVEELIEESIDNLNVGSFPAITTRNEELEINSLNIELGSHVWSELDNLPYEFEYGKGIVFNNELHILGSSYRSLYDKNFYSLSGENIFTKLEDLPYNFYQGSAVVYNGEIHIMGGYNSSNYKSYNYHYKWNGSEWIQLENIPFNFNSGKTIVYNNEIHLFGNKYSSSYYKSHYKWNGTTWTQLEDLPYNFYQGSVIVYDNEIHLLGSGNSSYHKSHYKWNGTTWTQLENLPYNFYNGSAVVYNDEIHILGSGYASAYGYYHYKWNGTTWTQLEELPYGFCESSAIIYNNCIYLIGGYDSRNGIGLSCFYEYNGSTWTQLEDLPYEFYNGEVVINNNEIYLLGGDSKTYKYKKCHYKLNNSTWTQLEDLPYEFYDGNAIVYNNEMHIIGSDNSSSCKNHYKFNGTTWTQLEDLPYSFYNGSVVIYRNEMHLIGSKMSNYCMNHYKFNGTTWTKLEDLPFDGSNINAVVYDDEVHFLGARLLSSYYDRNLYYKYDGSAWTNLNNLSFDFSTGSAVVYNDEIHIMCKTKHYKLNKNNFSFEEINDLPCNFYYGSSVVYNNEIHLLGNSVSPYYKSHYKFSKIQDKLVSFMIDNDIEIPFVNINDNLSSNISTYSSNKINNLINSKPNINDSNTSTTTTYSSDKIKNLLDEDYMTKENPVATGSFSMGRDPEGEIGDLSHAEGDYIIASGYASHAEGLATEASGEASHAEGANCIASGDESHAEGWASEASGDYSHAEGLGSESEGMSSHAEGQYSYTFGHASHAEGLGTTASGDYSHSEGYCTIASGEAQHVQGIYNIEDTENKYAHIVGNGEYENPSNAHTLDWDGNAWFAGDVTATDAEGNSVSLLDAKIPVVTTDNEGLNINSLNVSIGGFNWDKLEELPYEFGYGYALIYNDELHLLGSSKNKVHLKFNGTSWVQLEDLPSGYALYGGSAVIYNNEIHIVVNNFHFKYDGITWVQLDNLPYYFAGGSAVVYNGEIHLLGSNYSRNHYKFDGTNWTQLNDLPYDFYSGYAIVYNDEIHIITSKSHYKFNGTSWTQLDNLPYILGGSSPIIVYNDEIHIMGQNSSVDKKIHCKYDGSTWTRLDDLPYDLMNGSAIVYNDEIHLLGGYYSVKSHYKLTVVKDKLISFTIDGDKTIPFVDINDDKSSTTSTYSSDKIDNLLSENKSFPAITEDGNKYDINSLNLADYKIYEWTKEPDFIDDDYGFYFGTSAVYDNKLYALGGSDYYESTSYSQVYTFDGSTWTKLGDLPYEFSQGSAVVWNNELHLLGGRDSSKSHYKFNGITWTKLGDLPSNFQQGSAVVYNDEIHIMYNLSHYKYNGSSWTQLNDLPYKFTNSSALVYNNELHLLGSTTYQNTTYHYKWNGSTWTKLDDLPNGGSYLGVVYDNEIHLFNQHLHYKWNGSTWTNLDNLPYVLLGGNAIVYNNKIHILGGFDEENYYCSCEHYCFPQYKQKVSSFTVDNSIVPLVTIDDNTSSDNNTYSSSKIEDLLDEKIDTNIVLEVNRGGTGYNTIADTTYSTARYRASSLHSSETTPTTNGVIAWTYE